MYYEAFMKQTRVVTIQDISCFGKCSLTVALPMLSAMGLECAVIPTAVLSTHTGGFSGWTFRDLTDDIPDVCGHWKKEGLTFDGLYTGYLGSPAQAAMIGQFIDTFQPGTVFIDPAMADAGKLYAGFTMEIVDAMKVLCAKADYIVPNLTETCFLTGTEYNENDLYDRAAIRVLLEKLLTLGCRTAVITGVQFDGMEGAAALDQNGVYTEYITEHLPIRCHGTGDLYASIFFGALMRGLNLHDAIKVAADNTVRAIQATMGDTTQWYGVRFEECIPPLLTDLGLV